MKPPKPAADPRLLLPTPLNDSDDLNATLTIPPDVWNALSPDRRAALREAGFVEVAASDDLWSALREKFQEITTTDPHWTCGKLAYAALGLLRARKP